MAHSVYVFFSVDPDKYICSQECHGLYGSKLHSILTLTSTFCHTLVWRNKARMFWYSLCFVSFRKLINMFRMRYELSMLFHTDGIPNNSTPATNTSFLIDLYMFKAAIHVSTYFNLQCTHFKFEMQLNFLLLHINKYFRCFYCWDTTDVLTAFPSCTSACTSADSNFSTNILFKVTT